MKKLLITGASGFVGGFLVEEALRQGYEVYAGIRSSSSKQYLQDDRIRFFYLDFEKTGELTRQIRESDFDFIVHNAGLTKADHEEGYMKVNFEYTRNFIRSIQDSGIAVEKFLFVSSLAAFGPADSQQAELISESLDPRPVTAYGRSKLAAEEYIRQLNDFPYLIFRPTVVYGPREEELFTFYKMINKGVEAYIGNRQQQLSFIYVKDLCRILIESLKAPTINKAYFVSDGETYTAQYLAQLTREQLGKRTFKFNVPLPLVRSLAAISETTGRWMGKYPMFNREKVKELESLNWKCDIRPLQRDLGFEPRYLLDAGIAETINWYKKNNWL